MDSAFDSLVPFSAYLLTEVLAVLMLAVVLGMCLTGGSGIAAAESSGSPLAPSENHWSSIPSEHSAQGSDTALCVSACRSEFTSTGGGVHSVSLQLGETDGGEQTIDLLIELQITERGNQLSIRSAMPPQTLEQIELAAVAQNRSVSEYIVSDILSLDLVVIQAEKRVNITHGRRPVVRIQFRDFELNSVPQFRATLTDGQVNVLLRDPITPAQSRLLNTTEYRVRMPGRILQSTIDVTVGQTAIWRPTAGAPPAVIQSQVGSNADIPSSNSTTGGLGNSTSTGSSTPARPVPSQAESSDGRNQPQLPLSVRVLIVVVIVGGLSLLWWVRRRKIAAEE